MRRNPPIRRLGAFAVATLVLAQDAPSSVPNVDFERMGSVGLGGGFAGLDWFTESSPFAASTSSNNASTVKFSTDGDTLVMRGADGSYSALGTTNTGGKISALCWSKSAVNGTLYVAGSFTSLASTSSNNIVAYDVSTAKFQALGSGLSGPVDTLYCDDANKEVWAGGSFTAPAGSGGNVGLWSTQTSQWSAVPFGGLDGRVQSISPSADGSSLYFGGQFNTRYNDNSNSTNVLRLASVPIAPANTITTGNSGYLTPYTIPAAASEYGGLSVDAGPATDQDGYNDPHTLVCSNQGAWLARDGSLATINVQGNTYLTGQGVRIANSVLEGRGTKAFTLTSLPDNDVLTLTYSDPVTGATRKCKENCPLSTDGNVAAQDFLFVDGSRNLTGLRLVLDEWQGAGAALGYVELLSDGAYASYVESDNYGICGDSSNTSVLTVGTWQNGTAPSSIAGTTSGYMSSTVPVDQPTDTSITLYPYVGSSGYYDIYLVIPGCANLGDCDGRTTVDISVFPGEGSPPYTMTISQNVQEDTPILIYSGMVDASTATFSPTITLSLPANPESILGENYIVVAGGVQMVLTGLNNGEPSPWAPTESPGTVIPEPTGSPTASSGPDVSSSGSPQPGSSGVTMPGTPTPGTQTPSGTPGSQSPSGTAGSSNSVTPSGTPVVPTTSTTRGTTSTSTTTSATPSPTSVRVALGVYEWVRSSTANAASGLLANTTETSLTKAGFALSAANNASAAKDFAVHCIAEVNNIQYIGGDFSGSSYDNVVSVAQNGALAPLKGKGLNGPVRTARAINNTLYLGGEFTQTSAGDAVNHLAKYDGNTWSGLGGGVDGPVDDITPVDGGIAVVGNFTNVIAANGTATSTGGYAVYNTTSNEWATNGVLFGYGTGAANGNNATFAGGRFLGSSRNAVNGVASLVMNDDGSAQITTIPGVQFGQEGSAAPATAATKRTFSRRILSGLSLSARADAVAITEQPSPAPATLAGAFWTNSSADGKPRVTILGGNFTQGTDISGVAFVNNGVMTGPTPKLTGVVRALNVDGDELLVGGSDLSVPGIGNGIVKFDLAKNAWVENGIPGLVATGSSLHVNAIKTRPKTDTIVAAGNFASAGSYPCPAVCLWDGNQWQIPGSTATISSGEVKSVDFAENAFNSLVVGGSFVLNDESLFAATYHFDNKTWTPLPGLPGPVLSIAVNDKNATSVFASGYSSADNKPYLQRWDGSSWTEESAGGLQTGTVINNLAFVPMKSAHAASGAIQNDRMLMASGDVFLANTGNVSSALYDGSSWHPYLVGSTALGTLGSASSLFWSESSFSFNVRKYLARGLVVLVAMGIATGLILLLILLILLAMFCMRRHESKQQPQDVYEKDTTVTSSSHDHLILDSVQTALGQSFGHQGRDTAHTGGMAGRGAGVGAAGLAAGSLAVPAHMARPDSGESNYEDALSHEEYNNPGAVGSYEGSDEGREAVMKYDFAGPELQTGELAMRAGQAIIVLDDEQSDEWWYARDPETGREGVVPASYVT